MLLSVQEVRNIRVFYLSCNQPKIRVRSSKFYFLNMTGKCQNAHYCHFQDLTGAVSSKISIKLTHIAQVKFLTYLQMNFAGPYLLSHQTDHVWTFWVDQLLCLKIYDIKEYIL